MRTVLLALLSIIPPIAHAIDTSPIAVVNSLPVAQGAGLSTPKAALLNDKGDIQLRLNGHIESHANNAGSNTETLILDGESHSIGLQVDWGFAERWQAFIGAKALRNTPGQLDNLIDEWHDFFSLNGGDRDLQEEDQLLFFYIGLDRTAEVSKSNSAISDVQIGISRQLISSSRLNLAIHGEARLPNNKIQQALGSDKTDFSLAIAASGSGTSIGWHSNLGALAIGDNTLFAIPTRSSTWFSSFGAHWQASTRWRWSAQVDGHGAIFDSNIREINKSAWQLALAGDGVAKIPRSNSILQKIFRSIERLILPLV